MDAKKATDKKLADMEKELKKIYSEASGDLTKKWNDFMQKSAGDLADLKTAYDTAKKGGDPAEIKKALKQYQNAIKQQTLQNQYYKDMVDQITKNLANVNQKALSYVNGTMPQVYGLNYNASSNIADVMGVRFDLVDENTVKRMVKDGDIQLPNKKLSIPKDQRWNTKQLNSSVLQGILQGESMDDIAKRILPVVGNNQSAAIRNARTMVTGAQNRGHMDGLQELSDEGIVMRKVWMATPDDRTRDWHLEMDGQEQEITDSFVDGNGNLLDYPGDPNADPSTVYNCRCTMTTHVIGFRRSDGSISKVDFEQLESEHEKSIKDEFYKRVVAKEEKEQKKSISDAEPKKKVLSSPDNQFSDTAYSQKRKDDALWAKSPKEYDDQMREASGKAWKAATSEERNGIYEYTGDSDPHNMPLRGYGGSWRNHLGTENIDLDTATADMINATTRYIDRCKLPQDTWLQRGVGKSGAASFLNIPQELFRGSQEDMEAVLLGKSVRDDAFFSCGSSKGSGFSGVIFNVYCPEGTKGAYVEPFSFFGNGDGIDWDGDSTQRSFGSELETLLQRGTEFRITKVEKSGEDWFFDIEVIGQNARPLSEMFASIG